MGQYIFHTSLRNENNKYVFGSTVELCFTFAFSFSFSFFIHAQQLLGDSAQFITICVLFIKKKNFKLKIGSTILFTHLKIILLQYF